MATNPPKECFTEGGYRDRSGRGQQSLISIDSSYSSTAADVVCRAPGTAPVYSDSDEPLTLGVYLEREDSLVVSLRSQGRDAVLRSLDAWQMKSVYE